MPLFQSGKFPQAHDAAGLPAGAEHANWALWKIEESEEELLRQLDTLSFPQEELMQIRVAQRRLEWLACRLALQQLLPAGERKQMLKDEWGRPYLQLSEWKISLSHAYPFAAAAVHFGQAVGLDLEQPREQLLRIRHKFLSPQEQAWAGDSLERLCLCWTAKEALYKLNGKPGLIFAKDIQLAPAAAGAGLQAWLQGQPYALHHQWHENVLLCVAAGIDF